MIQPGMFEGGNSLTEQFDIIWNGINQNYVFWEIDPTDWDAVYTQYRPRFEELYKKDTVPTADLQKLYEEVCGTLIDHHMNIKVKNLKPAPAIKRTSSLSIPAGWKCYNGKTSFWISPAKASSVSRQVEGSGAHHKRLRVRQRQPMPS